jgi:hypothetical protein
MHSVQRFRFPPRILRCPLGRRVRGGAAVLAAVVLAAMPTRASAQTATMNAKATVVAPLSVSPYWSLDFRTVTRNRTTTVPYNDIWSGAFSVNGLAGSQIAVSFSLPVTLDRMGGGGSMPIGAWTGCHNATNSSGAGCATFTPSASALNLTIPGGVRYFFIGASVTPALSLPNGSYVGTITLQATYTGN